MNSVNTLFFKVRKKIGLISAGVGLFILSFNNAECTKEKSIFQAVAFCVQKDTLPESISYKNHHAFGFGICQTTPACLKVSDCKYKCTLISLGHGSTGKNVEKILHQEGFRSRILSETIEKTPNMLNKTQKLILKNPKDTSDHWATIMHNLKELTSQLTNDIKNISTQVLEEIKIEKNNENV